MPEQMPLKEILDQAFCNASEAVHVTYFPFFEETERIAYSAGECGWNGNLLKGCTSGKLYAVTDRGNENGPYVSNVRKMTGREIRVMENLGAVEETEFDRKSRSVVKFTTEDGAESFSVATSDYGKTWDICE